MFGGSWSVSVPVATPLPLPASSRFEPLSERSPLVDHCQFVWIICASAVFHCRTPLVGRSASICHESVELGRLRVCNGVTIVVTAVNWISTSSHKVSVPLPIQRVSVVDVVEPRGAEPGTSRCANTSTSSVGSNVKAKISSPFASCSEGEPPHEGAVQSIDVVDSWALPRFSTTIQAWAVPWIRPYPSLIPNPLGPVTESPLVRRTSRGNWMVVTIDVSSLSVKLRSTKLLSSPKALLGIPTLNVIVTGLFGMRLGWTFAPFCKLKVQPEGSALSSHVRLQSAVREPSATNSISIDSVEPGDMRGVSIGRSIRATYGSTIANSVVALLLSSRASVRLPFTSKIIVKLWIPSSAVTTALKVSGPPSPEGETGLTSSKRSRTISFPFINKTTSRSSSFSMVPILENCPVTVTCWPGSGSAGLKLIPLWSASGAKSAAACETSVSPINMSRIPSPSMSAIAGPAHTLWGIAKGDDHSLLMSAEAPVSPSNAQRRWPKATIISGTSLPSRSIQIGGETAISSLSLPVPRCKSRVHSFKGVVRLMSWHPTIPFLLKLSEDSEYQVTQQRRSWIPSFVVSIGSGCASA